jgi:hypothetical protein
VSEARPEDVAKAGKPPPRHRQRPMPEYHALKNGRSSVAGSICGAWLR